MNYPYYVEFLDEALCKRSTNQQASILQQNLFVILTSNEMIALARLLTFKKKQMQVVARQDGTKIVHFARLLKYLFNPKRITDKNTNERVVELGSVATNAFIKELLDQKKATWKYLSISGSDYCWANSTDERKAALVGATATNDEA
jgi:hypothetical protein